MSACLETLLADTPERKAQADAADAAQRKALQQRAAAHYLPMAQQVLTDALRDACKVIECTARDAYGLAYWSQAEWEDNWCAEDPKGYAEWERLSLLANCRPAVEALPGHCWECECNFGESGPAGMRLVNRRFMNCRDHAHWAFTRLVPANDD